ncbi:MAG TPA: protein kinase [Candidatus Melainabacteria bacterium]|nr:protein kinase [Candidatus Melainabacteria bacterium]
MTNSFEKEQEVELKQSSIDEADEADEAGESKIELVPELPDGYELIEKLGEGGMGRVYRVRDLTLDKEFAIKILQQDLSKDASALKRFNQEIDAAAALSHANLISIYKHGTTHNGEPYLVMDYLEGPSLADLIEKGTDFAGNADRLLDIFIQICDALAHAHENGVIHRDIKPSNIIITKSADGKDLVKIVDFGIARVIEASNRETHNLTQTGEVFGSPHYMSPEQCLGLMLTQHSDIYSLGCTLYEAITGSPPFAGANPIQLVVKHINENVSGFDKDVKRSKALKQLETITLKCLSKEMDDRYASVTALKEDLEKVKAGKPIPKYVLANRAKPTITKGQAFAFSALAFGLLFLVGYYSSCFGNDSQSIIFLFMLVFFGPGFLFLVRSGLSKYRSIRAGNNSARQWWLMTMALSAGFAGLCYAPFLAGMILFGLEYNFPSPYKHFSMYTSVFHIPLLLSLVSSGICYFLFKAQRASVLYVSARLILTMLGVLWFISAVNPRLTSNFASQINDAIKGVRNLGYRNSAELETNFIVESAKTMAAKGDYDRAINTLELALKSKVFAGDRFDYLVTLANFYSDLGSYKKALAYLNQVDLEALSYRDSASYIMEKARCLHGLGKLTEARDALKNYRLDVRYNPFYNKTPLDLREVLILCSEGKYNSAKKRLDIVVANDLYPGEAVLLRAILEEQTGDLENARLDYKSIVYGSLWRENPGNLDKNSFLRIAYAMKRLGEGKEYSALENKFKKTEKIASLTDLKNVLGLVDDAVKLKIDDPPLSEAK